MLFSATMPQPILDITREYQQDPVMVAIGNERSRTAENIEQFYFDCPMGRKMDVLNLLLAKYDPKLSVVLSATPKKMVDELSEYLTSAGYQAVGIHRDLHMGPYPGDMAGFKSHRTRILIATDVAARGIDVENVRMPSLTSISQDVKLYVHRMGKDQGRPRGRGLHPHQRPPSVLSAPGRCASAGAKIQQAEVAVARSTRAAEAGFRRCD